MTFSPPHTDAGDAGKNDRTRSPGKWLGIRELAAILCMQLLFAFSFTLPSPVNGYYQHHKEHVADGLDEVFDQDSRLIIDSLVEDWHFLFNPQHHLLYHVATEGIYKKVIRPRVHHAPETVYLFLKIFTVLTGAAFMIALSRVLWEMGLPPWPRILLLLLSAVSVTAWFNFSAFETHSLGMAAIALYTLVILRMTVLRRFRLQEQILLGSSLAFLFLCRLDLVRFFAATAFLAVLPGYRPNWRRLTAVLAAALLASSLLYLPLISKYFKVPVSDAPRVLFHREDSARLRKGLGTGNNLTIDNLYRMVLATAVSSVIMPTGPEKFREPLAGASTRPLFAVTLMIYAAMLVRMALALWRDRKDSGAFVAGMLVNWAIGVGLYTWFNPGEPFLWLLEFLPLLVVLMGLWLKQGGRADWGLAGVGTALVLLNNIVYFYLPFRG
jgi:hypothetical protein